MNLQMPHFKMKIDITVAQYFKHYIKKNTFTEHTSQEIYIKYLCVVKSCMYIFFSVNSKTFKIQYEFSSTGLSLG